MAAPYNNASSPQASPSKASSPTKDTIIITPNASLTSIIVLNCIHPGCNETRHIPAWKVDKLLQGSKQHGPFSVQVQYLRNRSDASTSSAIIAMVNDYVSQRYKVDKDDPPAPEVSEQIIADMNKLFKPSQGVKPPVATGGYFKLLNENIFGTEKTYVDEKGILQHHNPQYPHHPRQTVVHDNRSGDAQPDWVMAITKMNKVAFFNVENLGASTAFYLTLGNNNNAKWEETKPALQRYARHFLFSDGVVNQGGMYCIPANYFGGGWEKLETVASSIDAQIQGITIPNNHQAMINVSHIPEAIRIQASKDFAIHRLVDTSNEYRYDFSQQYVNANGRLEFKLDQPLAVLPGNFVNNNVRKIDLLSIMLQLPWLLLQTSQIGISRRNCYNC